MNEVRRHALQHWMSIFQYFSLEAHQRNSTWTMCWTKAAQQSNDFHMIADEQGQMGEQPDSEMFDDQKDCLGAVQRLNFGLKIDGLDRLLDHEYCIHPVEDMLLEETATLVADTEPGSDSAVGSTDFDTDCWQNTHHLHIQLY